MKPHFHLHNGYNLTYVLAHVRWRVDIGQIISIEMKNVAESCKEFRAGTRSAHPLVYPSLIMGLIIASRALSSPTQIVLSLYCSNSVAPIHHSQDKLKISQRTNEANVFGPKPIPNIHGIKINGVEKKDKFSPKETRVSTSSSKHVDQHVITNVVPLQMIVHVEITEENKKSALYQKQKKY
ncbi:hypothetical protein RYX36_002767 [Vicia faba]